MTASIAHAGRWTSPRLAADGEAVAAWVAGTLAGEERSADALVVATLDAGARESVAFWRSSRETGLPFANPRAFPWTLSGSVTGRIAQELGTRGPTYTLVGRTDALVAALEHALEELASPGVSRVLVAALDASGEDTTRLAALWLEKAAGASGRAVAASRASADGATRVEGETASDALAATVALIEAGREAMVGTKRDGWVGFAPASRS